MKQRALLLICILVIGISLGFVFLQQSYADDRLDQLIQDLSVSEKEERTTLGKQPPTKKQQTIAEIADYGPKAKKAVPYLLNVYFQDGPQILSCWESEGGHEMCEGFGPVKYREDILNAFIKIGSGATEAQDLLLDIIKGKEEGSKELAMSALKAIGANVRISTWESLIKYVLENKSNDDLFTYVLESVDYSEHSDNQYFIDLVSAGIEHKYMPIRPKASLIATRYYTDNNQIIKTMFDYIAEDNYRTSINNPSAHLYISNLSLKNDVAKEYVLKHFYYITSRACKSGELPGGFYNYIQYLDTLSGLMNKQFDQVKVLNIEPVAEFIGCAKRYVQSPDPGLSHILDMAGKMGDEGAPFVAPISKNIADGTFRYKDYEAWGVKALEGIDTEEARAYLKKCRAIEARYQGSCLPKD